MIREVQDYLASVSRPRSTTAGPSTFMLWITMSFHLCGAVMLSKELCGIRIFWWIRAFAFTSPLPASVVGERYHHQCTRVLQRIWQKWLNNCSRWGQLIRGRSGFMALWILPVTLKPSTNILEPREGQGGVRVPLPGAIAWMMCTELGESRRPRRPVQSSCSWKTGGFQGWPQFPWWQRLVFKPWLRTQRATKALQKQGRQSCVSCCVV